LLPRNCCNQLLSQAAAVNAAATDLRQLLERQLSDFFHRHFLNQDLIHISSPPRVVR